MFCEFWNSRRVSTEKVENVVKPPQSPIRKKALIEEWFKN